MACLGDELADVLHLLERQLGLVVLDWRAGARGDRLQEETFPCGSKLQSARLEWAMERGTIHLRMRSESAWRVRACVRGMLDWAKTLHKRMPSFSAFG